MDNTYLCDYAQALQRQLILYKGLHYYDVDIDKQIESIIYSKALGAGKKGGATGAGGAMFAGIPLVASLAIARSAMQSCLKEMCQIAGLEYEEKTIKSICGVIDKRVHRKLAALITAEAYPLVIPGVASAANALLNYVMVYACGAVSADLLQELIQNGEIDNLIRFDKSKTTIYVQNTLSKMHSIRLFREARDMFLKEKEPGKFGKKNTVPEQEDAATEQED